MPSSAVTSRPKELILTFGDVAGCARISEPSIMTPFARTHEGNATVEATTCSKLSRDKVQKPNVLKWTTYRFPQVVVLVTLA